jgi:hypothetical protein
MSVARRTTAASPFCPGVPTPSGGPGNGVSLTVWLEPIGRWPHPAHMTLHDTEGKEVVGGCVEREGQGLILFHATSADRYTEGESPLHTVPHALFGIACALSY